MSSGTATDRRSTPSTTPRDARAAYQGVPGAFGEDAVRRFWQGRVCGHPVPTFDAVLDALTTGEVEWAVLPIWNSTIGRVAAARDALDARSTMVARDGEVDVPVHHCLLALPGTSLVTIRHVGSHPAALAQCRRLFRRHPQLRAIEAFDTAGAARQLAYFDRPRAAGEDRWYDPLETESPGSLAAIASLQAAATYGLTILERGVNDEPTNFTRFVALRAREAAK
jgi:prephenate dehydratase